MEINIRLKTKTDEKGRKHINFDIEELRENPQKLKMAETEEQKEQIIKRITEGKTEPQKVEQERGHQIWNNLIKELTDKQKQEFPLKEGEREKGRRTRQRRKYKRNMN